MADVFPLLRRPRRNFFFARRPAPLPRVTSALPALAIVASHLLPHEEVLPTFSVAGTSMADAEEQAERDGREVPGEVPSFGAQKEGGRCNGTHDGSHCHRREGAREPGHGVPGRDRAPG